MRLAYLILFTLTVGLAHGQDSTETDTNKIKIGVHLSMNASHVTGATFWGINKVGIFGGIYLTQKKSEQISFEYCLGYSQKGSFKPPNHKQGDYTSYKMQLDYAQFDFLVRYNRGGINYLGGLGSGYLLSHSETDENGQIILGNGEFSPVELFGTIGVNLPVSERLSLGLRGSHSILPVRKHVNGATFRLNRGQFSQVLSFLLRYNIMK